MNLLQMSLAGGIMILAVALLRLFALNRIPKTTFVVLWMVAALRLLVPLWLPSAASIYNIAPLREPVRQLQDLEQTAPALSPEPAADIAETALAADPGPRFPWLPLIWLAGALGCAGWFIAAYVRERLRFRFSLPAEQVRLTLPDGVRVRVLEGLPAPLTYGLFRPVILLPSSFPWEDEGQLLYVLAHELVHIRRLDVLKKWLFLLALCVHWFNPAVWLLVYLANQDLELRCDEQVLRQVGLSQKAGYARTLLAMECAKHTLSLTSGFSRSTTGERMRAILNVRRLTALSLSVSVVLVVCMTAAFATGEVSRSIDWEQTSAYLAIPTPAPKAARTPAPTAAPTAVTPEPTAEPFAATFIRTMQGFGLKNSDIRTLLSMPLSERRASAVMQQLQKKSRELSDSLRKLELGLDYISSCMQDCVMPLPVEIKSLPALHFLCWDGEYESYAQAAADFAPKLAQLARARVRTCQPYECAALHTTQTQGKDRVSLRCMLRTAEPVELEGFRCMEVPARPTVASVTSPEPAENWKSCFDSLCRWLERQGHAISGTPRLWFVRAGSGDRCADGPIEIMVPIIAKNA